MMKKVVVLLAVCTLAATSFAGLMADINYSTDSGGKWQFDGVDTIEFKQEVGIDDVQGLTDDSLSDQFVYIPELTLTSVSIAGGVVEASIGTDAVIAIKDSVGNVLLEGALGAGDFIAFNTISGAYTEFMADIVVTTVNNSIDSELLDGITVGTELDFNITLQHRGNFAEIIDQGQRASGTLSGSMSIVPEPATLLILGVGSLMIRRRK